MQPDFIEKNSAQILFSESYKSAFMTIIKS